MRKWTAITVLLVMGALKLPLEQAVTKRLREEKLLSAPPALSLREGLGQAGFAASLGGLRSLVASITVLQTVDAFENVDWGKVDGLYRIATQLQPRYAPYWVQAAEHMAFDAASSYRFDQNRRYALSEELFENHVRRGIEIMREGLRFNPDSARLWTRLGDIYSQRSGRSVIPGDRHAPLTGDPANAAECYLKGSELGALPIYERLGAYELVKAGDSGSLERARVILMRHYQRGHKPFRVIKDLKIIEEKLQVPPAQRIQDQLPKPGR